jgi:hypothetical protein
LASFDPAVYKRRLDLIWDFFGEVYIVYAGKNKEITNRRETNSCLVGANRPLVMQALSESACITARAMIGFDPKIRAAWSPVAKTSSSIDLGLPEFGFFDRGMTRICVSLTG